MTLARDVKRYLKRNGYDVQVTEAAVLRIIRNAFSGRRVTEDGIAFNDHPRVKK